jgi:hypothetical protein
MINTKRSSSSSDRKSEEQGLPESRLPQFSAEVLKSKKVHVFGMVGGFRKIVMPNNG